MYCSRCGNPLKQALSYCNRCGASLNSVKDSGETNPSPTLVESLVWAIVATTITVLGMVLGALVLMKGDRIPQGLGNAFVLAGLLALLGVDGIFIWRLFQAGKKIKERPDAAQRKDFTTEELNAAEAQSLPAPPPSVTEQTTRTLEPVYREEETKL
jgi:hypothetical protein